MGKRQHCQTEVFQRLGTTIISLFLLLLCSCDNSIEDKKTQGSSEPKKELLIYCGITMAQPVMELAALVEKEKNCIVKVSYGESRVNLF